MARKRMIKPEFWTDEKIIELPIPGRLLFIGLLNFADDEGIFRNSPKSIKCEVFPADVEPSANDVKDYLELMQNLKLIVKGEDLEGNELLKIKNWHDHQKINHPTPSKYIFKPLLGGDSISPKLELSEDSVSPNGELTEDSLIVKSSLVKDSLISIDKSSKKNQDFTFERFYSLYPKKQSKKTAESSFKRLKKGDLKALEVGLDGWLRFWKESGTDAQYIPLPATWLNQRRWEDEIPSVDEIKEFKSDLDKEIYNRNQNIVEQSKRMRDYIAESKDNAIDEVPNLLEDFKKGKRDAKSIGEIIGQVIPMPEADTSTDG